MWPQRNSCFGTAYDTNLNFCSKIWSSNDSPFFCALFNSYAFLESLILIINSLTCLLTNSLSTTLYSKEAEIYQSIINLKKNKVPLRKISEVIKYDKCFITLLNSYLITHKNPV